MFGNLRLITIFDNFSYSACLVNQGHRVDPRLLHNHYWLSLWFLPLYKNTYTQTINPTCPVLVTTQEKATILFTSASALVIYVSKLPLGACSIRACSISKLRKSGVNSPTAVSFTILSQTPRRPSYFQNSTIA